MPSPAILDVAIGIAFVYLFLSLICSVVNEAFAAMLSFRSKNLVRGINSLFSGSKTAGDQHLFVDAIYAHGLIRGLFPNPQDASDANPVGVATAASANVVTKVQAAAGALLQNPFGNLVQVVGELRLPSVMKVIQKWNVNLPSYIPSGTFATALVDIISPANPTRARVLDDIRTGIASLPPSSTKQALLSLVAETQKDAGEFQTKVEAWFNDSMDRASGWYKRRTQKILFIIGVFLTLLLNVDTVKLAQDLWTNPTAAKATANLAEQFVNNNPVKTSDDLQKQAEVLINIGNKLPFAFGWQGWIRSAWSAKEQGKAALFLGESFVGWLITAIALSLGAPFWFDVLNKFMVVRSTIKPHEKSETETSKD